MWYYHGTMAPTSEDCTQIWNIYTRYHPFLFPHISHAFRCPLHLLHHKCDTSSRCFISFLSFFIFDVVVEYRLGYQIHSLHLTPSPGADIHPYLTMHPCVHLYVDYLHLQVSTIYWHDGYRMTIQWHDDRNPSDHCQPFIAMQTVPNSPSQNYYIRQHSVCLQTSFTYPEDHHIWW